MLHSRYNPVAEAERYINSLTLKPDTQFFILIEPGLGYIIPILREKRPDAKIIALHVTEPTGAAPTATPSWSPAHKETLQNFLESEIPDAGATVIQVIEWRPAMAMYGERYLRLLAETVDFIRRIDANRRTNREFGRRWFSNFFKNLRLVNRCCHPPTLPFNTPVIVTGAGPSLENAIPLIREQRSEVFLLAASSSVLALETRGVIPDMIISTDGGGWALMHLYECLRDSPVAAAPPFVLAASMNAALPSQCASLPLLLLSDGSLWQGFVLHKLGIPFVRLLQRGTVTASALDLAFILTKGSVVISGTDLAINDIRIHAHPYSFERQLELRANRLLPLYNQYFTRARAIADGKSHDIYAAWFKSHIAEWPKRFYSLGSNSAAFNEIPQWDGAAYRHTSQKLKTTRIAHPAPVKAAVALLSRALSNTAIKQELASLLLPDESAPDTVSIADLKYIIGDLTKAQLFYE
ncbi:MAG: DUF115 domain-containing protein [Treponema sp.]|jgi:hypothetical protein|nr:DUF115 domain-containing protein [Treponema sp.]